jgi:hypothetical protein
MFSIQYYVPPTPLHFEKDASASEKIDHQEFYTPLQPSSMLVVQKQAKIADMNYPWHEAISF